MTKQKKPKPKKKKAKPKPATTEEKMEEQPEQEGPEPQTGVVDIAALPVWQILPIFLGIFDRVAWQRMGLVVNPQTQQVEKDLEQARVAIDCYDFVLKHLSDRLDPETKIRLEARLTDLKLNFASQA